MFVLFAAIYQKYSCIISFIELSLVVFKKNYEKVIESLIKNVSFSNETDGSCRKVDLISAWF